MKPIDVLKRLNLVCWSVLLVGQRRGWATKSDISDHAIKLLSFGLDDDDENIAVLASSVSLDDSEVEDLLLQVGGSAENPDVLEKWRLAKLVELVESAFSEEEKIDRLQELYAEFDYPEDMSSCSIYSHDRVDPLVAVSDVTSALKKKLLAR